MDSRVRPHAKKIVRLHCGELEKKSYMTFSIDATIDSSIEIHHRLHTAVHVGIGPETHPWYCCTCHTWSWPQYRNESWPWLL